MAIFRSDTMTPANAAPLSTNRGTAYAPLPSAPQVSSVPATQTRSPSTSAQLSALSSRAPSTPAPTAQPAGSSNPLFSGIQSAVQSLGAVAQALANRGSQSSQPSSPPVSAVSANPPSITVGNASSSDGRTSTPYTTGNATTPANLPPDGLREPTPVTLSNEQLLARYRPELVDTGNGFAVTRAGLGEPPRRENFASLQDFQNAEEAYRENVLAEESAIASSSAFQQSTNRNAELAAAQSQRARSAAFESTQSELERRQKNERQALIQSLANRGLAPGASTQADDKLREFDRLAAQEREARYSEFLLGQANISDEQRKRGQQAIDDRIKAIKEAMTQFETIKLRKATADSMAKKIEIADRRQKADQLHKEGIIDLKERDLLIKGAEAESKQDLRESQAGNLDQKTAESKTLTPLKAEDLKAGTEKKTAETERIKALTPVEIDRMKAQIAKLKRVNTGSGGKAGTAVNYTPEELQAVYKLNGGKAPISEKSMAQLLNQVRVNNGDVDNLVTIQDQRITQTTAAREAGKPKTSTDAFLSTLINGG